MYFGSSGPRPVNKTLRSVIANRQASDDYVGKRQCVGSSIAVWMIFIPLKLVAGAIIVWFIPQWLDVAPELAWPVRVATTILVVQLLVTGLSSVPLAVLEGENRGYKLLGLSTATVVLGGVLTVFAVRMNWGVAGVAAATLVNAIMTGMLFLVVARSQIDWFGAALPPRALLREFFGLNWWFIAWRFLRLIYDRQRFRDSGSPRLRRIGRSLRADEASARHDVEFHWRRDRGCHARIWPHCRQWRAGEGRTVARRIDAADVDGHDSCRRVDSFMERVIPTVVGRPRTLYRRQPRCC